MSCDPKQNIPFTNTYELRLHLDISQLLIDKLKENVSLIPSANVSDKEQLEKSVVTSLNVLIEGFANAILSIQQGYIQR
jgi:hypothetical protein